MDSRGILQHLVKSSSLSSPDTLYSQSAVLKYSFIPNYFVRMVFGMLADDEIRLHGRREVKENGTGHQPTLLFPVLFGLLTTMSQQGVLHATLLAP